MWSLFPQIVSFSQMLLCDFKLIRKIFSLHLNEKFGRVSLPHVYITGRIRWTRSLKGNRLLHNLHASVSPLKKKTLARTTTYNRAKHRTHVRRNVSQNKSCLLGKAQAGRTHTYLGLSVLQHRCTLFLKYLTGKLLIAGRSRVRVEPCS